MPKNRLNIVLALLIILLPAASFAEDLMPALLTHEDPKYPKLLRRKGVEGIAIIQLTVDSDGSVESPLAIGYTDEEIARGP